MRSIKFIFISVLLALSIISTLAYAQSFGPKRFDQLPPATVPLTGNELIPLEQNNQTRQTTIGQIKGSPGGNSGDLQYNNSGTLGGYGIGAGLNIVGNQLVSTSTTGGSTPSGTSGNIQYNAGGGLFGGLSNSNSAYKFLTNDGGTSLSWANPANLVDPRTYGAVCPGSGITGGLQSSAQGVLITNGGTGYVNGTYAGVAVTGGTGFGAVATFTVSGNAVTSVSITTAGTGFKQGDQISAAAGTIGGGSGFTAQVAHLNGNGTPIYDGVHDSTAAFKAAFAAAQNTGQSVLVPDGCWVSPTSNQLDIPQGVSMVGMGFNPAYGYYIEGGSAHGQPVLYIIGHPAYAIKFGARGGNSFSGFQINAWGDGQAATFTTCIGTTDHGGGGDPINYTHYMAYKGCANGYGSWDTSAVFFLHSDHTEYGGVWQRGIYGQASDLFSSNDQCDSGQQVACMELTGGGGEARIEGLRAEFTGGNGAGCIYLNSYSGVQITDSQFDSCTPYGINIAGSSSDIYVANSSFQNSATAHINFARTTTAPANVHFSNLAFSVFQTNYPNYGLQFTTSGTYNDNVSINGGKLKGGVVKDVFNFQNGTPPHLTVDVQGMAIQGKNANGLLPSHSSGLPSNNWSRYLAFGDQYTYYNLVLTTGQYYPAVINSNLNAAETTYASLFAFDCDIADQQIFPNTNPVNYGNTVYSWLPAAADPTYGGYNYSSFNGHRTDTHGCRMAALSWMATPADYKTSAQSATTTGTWGNASIYSNLLGKTTTQNGDQLSFTTTTYGGPLYLYYALQATATNVASGGTFLYSLDGTTTGTIATGGQGSWTYNNSCGGLCPTSRAPSVVRIPVASAGAHTLSVSVTSASSASNPVTILGIGTPPGKPYLGTGPSVFYGGQVWQQGNTNPAFTATYNSDEMTDANTLKGDGLPVNFVPIRDYLGYGLSDITSGYYTSSGQQHIADAFQGAMQFQKNAVTSGPVDPRNYGAVCNAQTRTDFSTTNGSNIVSAGGYSFTSADIGKSIGIQYALSGTSTITGLSGSSAIVSNNAFATSSGNYGEFGNNDTAAMQALSSSGYSIQAPDKCLIRNLKIASGQSVIGTGVAQGYGIYLDQSGLVRPRWYILGSGSDNDPAFGIDIQNVEATGLRGFAIFGPAFPYNGAYNPFPYTYGYQGFGPGTVCVGGDGNGTGSSYWTGANGSGHAFSVENMDIENCMVGYGRSPGHSGGYLGAQTRNSSILRNGIATYGPFSDTSFIDDDITGNFFAGYSLGPQLGAASSAGTMRIANSHVEYNGDGIVCNNCASTILTGLSYDANGLCGIRFIGGWGGIQIVGGQYRDSGWGSGNILYPFSNAMFCFNSNTTNNNAGPDGLTITGAQIDKQGTTGATPYVFRSDSAFGTNQPISVIGGSIQGGFTTARELWASTPPPKYEIHTTDAPVYRAADLSLSFNSNQAMGLQTLSATPGTIIDALNASTTFNSTIGLPGGPVATRPTTPTAGMFRSNSQNGTLEYYNGSAWSVFNGAVPGLLNGLVLSNDATTPNTVLDIGYGTATSDDGSISMTQLPSTKTTGSWTVGYGNGCLDTGSVTTNTWYKVFMIERPDTSVIDYLCSTSATAPTLPTSYTKKRLIGFFRTDGSSNILSFKQVPTAGGFTFYHGTPTLSVNDTALGSTATSETLNVPSGVKVQPICEASISNASPPVAVYLSSLDETDLAPTTTSPFSAAPGYTYLSSTSTGLPSNSSCNYLTTNTSSQIRARSSAASTTLTIVGRGFNYCASCDYSGVGKLAIDGFGTASALAGTTTNAVTISTNSAPDVIMLGSYAIGTTTTISSVTDTYGLSWTKRATRDSNSMKVEEWFAQTTTSPLTSDVITVTYAAATGSVSSSLPPSGRGSNLIAFGVSGANTSTPFDPHAGIPASAGTGFGRNPSISNTVTTTKPIDMVINFYSVVWYQNGTTDFYTKPSDYYQIVKIPSYMESSYKITGGPLSSSTALYSATTNDNNIQGLITDVIQASGQ